MVLSWCILTDEVFSVLLIFASKVCQKLPGSWQSQSGKEENVRKKEDSESDFQRDPPGKETSMCSGCASRAGHTQILSHTAMPNTWHTWQANKSSSLSSVLTVSCSHGVSQNPDAHSLRLASRHLWQEQFPGRGGCGPVQVGLWPHPDELLSSESEGKKLEMHCFTHYVFIYQIASDCCTWAGSTNSHKTNLWFWVLLFIYRTCCQTFQTTPTLAPSNGRGEMRLAVRFLPQIIHSEGVLSGSFCCLKSSHCLKSL